MARAREQTATRSSVSRLVAAVLPPLLSRIVWRALRGVFMLPQTRLIIGILVGLALAALTIPATLAALLVWLTTHDQNQALSIGGVVLLAAVGTIGAFALSVRSKWRRIKSRF